MAAAWTGTSGTLTNTTASLAANTGRRQLIASNNSDTVMTLDIAGATATANVGISIPAGTAIMLGRSAGGNGNTCPNGAVSLFCAGASKAYSLYEC